MSEPQKPRVSVLMVVFDPHPDYFPQAVRSILDQTFRDLELVIVEDPAPKRNAADLLALFDDERIRYHRNPERTSLLHQRKQTLAMARGDLVAVLDADDVWEPDRLKKQVDYLQRHAEVTVLGSYVRVIDGRGQEIGYRYFPLHHDALVKALECYNPICQSSVLMRREAVIAAGGYQFGAYIGVEDYELWCRLARCGAHFATFPEPLIRYRLHDSQLKARALHDLIRGTLQIKAMYRSSHEAFRTKARRWLEQLLLFLPPGLVVRLIRTALYSESSLLLVEKSR